AGPATDTGAGTGHAQTPLADRAGTGSSAEVPHGPHGNGPGAQAPPRGIANRRRPIPLASSPRLRGWLWLAAGSAAVILAVAALPFLIGPDRATVTERAHPTPSPTGPFHPIVTVTLTGHSDSVWAVAFSPNGRTLATGSVDHTAKLWDVSDPAHPTATATITGHSEPVRALAFSPNGRTLATASLDHTAKLWDVSDPAPPPPTPPLTSHTHPL